MKYDLDTAEGMANAVRWQEKMLSLLKDGGTWYVPYSGSAYTVYHHEKTAVRLGGLRDAQQKIERVFNAMGWTVREAN